MFGFNLKFYTSLKVTSPSLFSRPLHDAPWSSRWGSTRARWVFLIVSPKSVHIFGHFRTSEFYFSDFSDQLSHGLVCFATQRD